MRLGEDVERLERELLTEAVRRDRARLEQILAPDFREFGSSGRVWDRQSIIQELTTAPWTAVKLSQFACEPIGEGVALATYRTDRSDGTGRVLRSSIWVCRDGEWRMIFHQATKAAEEDRRG